VFESLRRFGFPLRLVAARFRVGGKRLLLVAAGVIAGAAVLAAVLAGRLVMQDRALAQATAGLAPGDREVAVAWSGATNDFTRLNRLVVPRVQQITGHRPAAAMLFREASIQQRLVNLRAADDLGRYVRLVSGRLPAPCHPSHCEVLRLQGAGPIPSTPHLKLIEVGRAVLRPDAPFGPFVLPAPPTEMVAQAVRYHTPQPSPIVIANGVAGLSDNTELQTFYRSYAWFVPIRGGDVHPWEVAAFRSKVQRLTAEIEASSDEFQVTAPTDALATAASSSTAAARRLLLLGGEGGALLLAFTILAAAAMRRDVTDARRRLVWFGARRWQVELHTLAESLSLATAGTVVGWAVGGAAAAIVASRAGSPVADVVRHALLSPSGLLAAAGVAAVAGLLLYATVRAPSLHLGRAGVTPLDVAALGAVAVVLVGWARGSVDSQQLTGGSGTSAFLLLVPALIVFAAAVCAARLLGPTLRALGRAGRRGPIALRLAAASLARNPGHAAIAATFLVASLGLALFAVTYRSTLLRGQEDEASFAVPASFVLSEDLSQLVPVLHGAPLDRYPGTTTSVLRLSGNVPSGTTFSFLGLPADHVASVGGWRADFASEPLHTLAAAITPKRNVALHTTSLPAGRQFSLPVRAKGDDVGVRAIFRSRLGDYEAVALGHTNGSKLTLLHGRIPFIGATLAQLRLDILNQDRLSANGGLGLQPSAKGELSFGAARVNGRLVRTPFASWVGSGGVSGGATRLGYVLTSDQNGVFRPTQPTDGVPLPILATPRVIAEAGPHGIIPLQVEGEQIAARIVGTIRRFPSVAGDAVVADRTDAATILDTRSPGLGTTDELWVTVPAAEEASAATALSHSPFTQLSLQSRADTLTELRADPLARGALLTLAGTAAVALLLALVGLLLSVVGDVRDDRGELFDLEAQGASPATIRAHLRLRALLVASFGVVGGLALGAILTSLVIALVSVTAAAARPEPPLQLVLDVPLLLLAAVLYVLVAVLLVGAATSLRGRAPQRAAEALT
jgi:predicted lysophospholipase L1 biosynthesis ABC-type transport system permease subunit